MTAGVEPSFAGHKSVALTTAAIYCG